MEQIHDQRGDDGRIPSFKMLPGHIEFPQIGMLPRGTMAADDVMTIDERLKYLRRMQPRYVKADRKGRGQLLGEIQAVTGVHRKSVVRLLGGGLTRQ